MDKFGPLSIRDPQVQELLWKHVNPEDFRVDYTKLDAMKYIEEQVLVGEQMLWGNYNALLRCEGNKFTSIVMPHILGEGKYFKRLVKEGCDFARENNWKQVHIYTSRGSIQRMLMKLGFDNLGGLPGYLATKDGVVDVAILGLKL